MVISFTLCILYISIHTFFFFWIMGNGNFQVHSCPPSFIPYWDLTIPVSNYLRICMVPWHRLGPHSSDADIHSSWAIQQTALEMRAAILGAKTMAVQQDTISTMHSNIEHRALWRVTDEGHWSLKLYEICDANRHEHPVFLLLAKSSSEELGSDMLRWRC